MLHLLYEPLPEHITADGVSYPILTDFRAWLQFSDMLADKSIPTEEKLLLLPEWLLARPPAITGELVEAMLAFLRADALEPDRMETASEEEAVVRPPCFSWEIDAKYVLGDFRRYYGMDLLHEQLHWWTFRSLFAALPDESQCQKRIAYRSMDPSQIRNAAERERIQRIQRQIALPFTYDDDAIGAMLGGVL